MNRTLIACAVLFLILYLSGADCGVSALVVAVVLDVVVLKAAVVVEVVVEKSVIDCYYLKLTFRNKINKMFEILFESRNSFVE